MSENRHRRVTRLHAGLPDTNRWRKMNSPPKGQPFIWLTHEMLKSEAWRALSKPALGVVFRIASEHMSHAGTQNGDLPVTYADFESYGVRRKSVADAIAQAEALGLIDIVERGRRAFAELRRPSKYGLTWLPRADGMPPSNRWRRITTQAQARAILSEANQKRGEERAKRKEQAERRKVRQFITTIDMERGSLKT